MEPESIVLSFGPSGHNRMTVFTVLSLYDVPRSFSTAIFRGFTGVPSPRARASGTCPPLPAGQPDTVPHAADDQPRMTFRGLVCHMASIMAGVGWNSTTPRVPPMGVTMNHTPSASLPAVVSSTFFSSRYSLDQ